MSVSDGGTGSDAGRLIASASGGSKSSGSASATVGRLASASGGSKSSGSASATVRPATAKPAPPTTSAGYPVKHVYSLQFSEADDQGIFHAELIWDGEVIWGGMGDDKGDAVRNLRDFLFSSEDPEE